ncbi:hypothetical protein [Cytobacillus dafuensis]|uniref:Uncharacterized protein n=1 Tax=Cytobacillus dafuensis TaxID=1742359 RepID=A0A5B8Z340_CYTDA|nr:hypothetical protein [Cytobacillus dafuensis]QED47510.1 hypothetical protein FSZ17_09720 [Cytobacillus dafuensis]
MKQMEDRHQFEKLIKPIQRQLLFQLIIKEVQLLLIFAGATSFLLLLIARILVIPFLKYYFILMFIVLFSIFIIRIWKNHPNMQKAVSIYNQFVPDDRVVTAFNFLKTDSIMAELQLADAVKNMKKSQDIVRKRKKNYLYPKWLLISFVLTSLAVLLFFSPNEKINSAKQQEKEIKLVAETEKKLKEEIKKEKDPNVKKALKEALEKVAEQKSVEEALKELAKQKKELELKALKEKEKQLALENWKQDLKNNGLTDLEKMLNQKNLAAIEKELAKLNEKWNELNEEQKNAFNQLAENEGQLTEEELAKLMEQIENALESEEFLAQLAAAQQALQNVGLAMQNQMAANGLPPGQLAFTPSGQSSQQGTGANGQQGASNSNGQQQGQNNQNSNNGNGNGSGNGNGNGAGAGSGSGSGSGNGQGLGGTGAGKGQGSRELLTIPNHLEGLTNIETDQGLLGEGNAAEQTEGTGPVLKGTIRPYSEVFGTYEKAYRQSTERYKLPSDLEEIVKNYFTNIDPNKE